MGLGLGLGIGLGLRLGLGLGLGLRLGLGLGLGSGRHVVTCAREIGGPSGGAFYVETARDLDLARAAYTASFAAALARV